MTNKFFLGITICSMLIMYVFTDPSTYWLHNGYFRAYENNYLEPLFLLVLGGFISSVVCLVFRVDFKKNISKFLIWYIPIAYAATFLFPTTGYTMIYRYDAAVLLSSLMVIVTAGLILKEKFLKKKLS